MSRVIRVLLMFGALLIFEFTGFVVAYILVSLTSAFVITRVGFSVDSEPLPRVGIGSGNSTRKLV